MSKIFIYNDKNKQELLCENYKKFGTDFNCMLKFINNWKGKFNLGLFSIKNCFSNFTK